MNDDIYSKSGSGGAILFGCEKVINIALMSEVKILDIFSSQLYISKIMKNEWEKKSGSSKKFSEFVNSKKQEIELHFNYLQKEDDKMKKAQDIAKKAAYLKYINYRKLNK